VIASAVLSLNPSSERRIWLVIDELAALGKLASLESALTMGRKNGLCVVAGLQSIAQLDRIYGRESAQVLRACFRNLLVLAISKTDPDTAEAMSRALGEQEVRREEETRSHGSSGNSRSHSVRHATERVVMPAEISGLPNLVGFLALAGDSAIQRITLTPQRREMVTEPYLEEALC
jgi:type IV secretory pathway TraG/TraD family ATPase VirD4